MNIRTKTSTSLNFAIAIAVLGLGTCLSTTADAGIRDDMRNGISSGNSGVFGNSGFNSNMPRPGSNGGGMTTGQVFGGSGFGGGGSIFGGSASGNFGPFSASGGFNIGGGGGFSGGSYGSNNFGTGLNGLINNLTFNQENDIAVAQTLNQQPSPQRYANLQALQTSGGGSSGGLMGSITGSLGFDTSSIMGYDLGGISVGDTLGIADGLLNGGGVNLGGTIGLDPNANIFGVSMNDMNQYMGGASSILDGASSLGLGSIGGMSTQQINGYMGSAGNIMNNGINVGGNVGLDPNFSVGGITAGQVGGYVGMANSTLNNGNLSIGGSSTFGINPSGGSVSGIVGSSSGFGGNYNMGGTISANSGGGQLGGLMDIGGDIVNGTYASNAASNVFNSNTRGIAPSGGGVVSNLPLGLPSFDIKGAVDSLIK